MPTNAEVLGKALLDFESLEYEGQGTVADYIDCPNAPICEWDGKAEHHYICTECKREWLKKEWDI